ncbi:MAG TPA: phosphoribosylglycinamide formyltransferase [Kofleriaceae bacterium]|jgi:phosphoribosylglycinamide formyltransferase-1|nr:phosphoribosylglycinamide formyltransferase [Kofleriaceae bacterium]
MRFAVLVSGTGSNLAALLAAEAAGALAPGEIVVVVSNRPGVAALDKAAAAGKPAIVVDHKAYPGDRPGFERALLAALAEHRVDAVVLAGFMRVLTATFIDAFPARIINTHPALLPAFPGVDAAAQAIAYGVKLAGVTVHFVDAGVDTGPIIAQRAVPVHPDDDAATLQRRIQAEEHRLLPAVARALAQGRLVCEGRRVTIADATEPDADQLV